MDDEDFYGEGEDFGGEEEYEFEYEPEAEFQAERGAFERAGGAQLIGTTLKYVTNPIEKFKIVVEAVYNKIKSSARISEGDLRVMMDKVSSIHLVQYKNPPAYVLGYIASKGGKEITKERVELSETLIPAISEKEEAITPPDIIRYAVFWTKLK